MSPTPFLLCCAQLFVLLLLSLATISLANDEAWRDCETFFAPAMWKGGGWGVFAARSFSRGEIVEVAPLFVPMPLQHTAIANSVLRDYIYGYVRLTDTGELDKMAAVVAGSTMFCNHHPSAPNVEYHLLGIEPAQSVGLVALRNIAAGEELYTSYGEVDDGGRSWFGDRNLPLLNIPPVMQLNETELGHNSKRFCSKIHAGIGQPFWLEHFLPKLPSEFPFSLEASTRLAPVDVGVGGAVAKVRVLEGQVLEAVPALVLAKNKVEGSALAPLVLWYKDLPAIPHQGWIHRLHHLGHLVLQHQGDDTDWVRTDEWNNQFEQLAILPIAGNVVMVLRVGDDEPNCKLEIMPSSGEDIADDGNAGIALVVSAIKDIQAGETLRLNIPSSSATDEEYRLLAQELERTGNPPMFIENGNGYKRGLSAEEL